MSQMEVISKSYDNDINNYSVNELNTIRISIENMSKFDQVELLRILYDNHKDVILNENKYGVHINLTELPNEIIQVLKLHIDCVNSRESTLSTIEKQKENFKNIYFSKDNKDNLK